MSQAVIRRRENVISLRRRDGLIQFADNITSQNGEDGVLEHLFALLLPNDDSSTQTQKRHHYYLVDVGAWDGKHLSNTYSLLQKGWKGILIEADGERFQELQKLHSQNVCLHRCVSAAKSSQDSLDSILRQHGPSMDLPNNFEFLSIDVDGGDYWAWSSVLGSYWRPKVVCIEFNPTMPNDLIYIPPADDSLRHGASLAALVELGKEHQYVLVETTLYNAIFVTSDLHSQHLTHLVPDTSIEALHEVTMGTALYQLYDGTLKLHGCKKLLWHRRPMDEVRLQILPAHERQFPFAPCRHDFDASQAVDVSAWCCSSTTSSDDTDERRRLCSAQLMEQLFHHGFCHVRGTGIDANLCRKALQQTRLFLHEADESVRRECLARDRARRGYSPMCTENFASLVGQQSANDLVKKFRVGPTKTASSDDTTTSSLLQPNVWPSSNWEGSSNFRSTVEAYFDGANRAANSVILAICRGILNIYPELEGALQPLTRAGNDNDESSAAPATTTSILTLLGYCMGSRHKGKNKGPLVASHTDVGVITFLLFDDGNCATLQRHRLETEGPDSQWINVSLPLTVPDDPIFVVNVADCLSEISGGRLPSTLHRVVANRPDKGGPRSCCALFVGLQPDEQLQIKGESMSYEEWRKRRIDRAMSVLKS